MVAIKHVEFIFGNFALIFPIHRLNKLLSYLLRLLSRIIVLLQGVPKKCHDVLLFQYLIVVGVILIEILVKKQSVFLFVL